MRSVVRTVGITIAASLGLHGGLLLLAAAAMTVLPAWTSPHTTRRSGQKLQVARACRAGDKYFLGCRIENRLSAPAPKAGTMHLLLQGLWEIQEVTPLTGQPSKYTFTLSGNEVVTDAGPAALFRHGAVISGFVDPKGEPAWTVDGVAVEGAMKNLLRQALPLPAARDRDELAACFQPQTPVKTGDTWTPDIPATTARLAMDGIRLAAPLTGTVTLSEPLQWDESTPGRQLQIALSIQAAEMSGLPEGSEVQSNTIKGEGELFLPDDPALPVLREKWVTDGTLTGRLPGMEKAETFRNVTTVERELSIYREQKAEATEVEVTFVPAEKLPSLTAKLPKPAEAQPQPPPSQQGNIHVVSRKDMPVVAPFESDTPFISDRNMRAAATSAPVAGADPRLGNQEGADVPGVSLFNASASPGGEPEPPPAPPAEPVAQTPAPAPPPVPAAERPPEKNGVQTESPDAPAPVEKRAEVPEMRERPLDALALTEAKPRQNSPVRPPTDPVQPNSRPGQKPVVSSVKTKVEGSLSVRGQDSSVDAKDTPEGRFYSAMHDSIGLIWNTRLASVHGLSGSGVVEVEFDIDIHGRVSNVKLVDPGKANPILEDVCLTSVIKAKIPPLPASLKREIQDPLSGGKLHQKINFYKIPRS